MKKVTLKEAKQILEKQEVRLLKYRHAMVAMSMEDILWMIEPPELAKQYVEFYNAHPAFAEVCAGARHHHWWKGGLEEHVKEMVGLGFDMLELYSGDLTGIDASDIVICCFLHDFSKIWTYEPLTEEDRKRFPNRYLKKQEFKYTQKQPFGFVDEETKCFLELAKHGIHLTERQASAILFCEGGYSDRNFGYGGTTRTGDQVMANNPLAVFMHVLDMWSSQVLGKSLYGPFGQAEEKPKVENAVTVP